MIPRTIEDEDILVECTDCSAVVRKWEMTSHLTWHDDLKPEEFIRAEDITDLRDTIYNLQMQVNEMQDRIEQLEEEMEQ